MLFIFCNFIYTIYTRITFSFPYIIIWTPITHSIRIFARDCMNCIELMNEIQYHRRNFPIISLSIRVFYWVIASVGLEWRLFEFYFKLNMLDFQKKTFLDPIGIYVSTSLIKIGNVCMLVISEFCRRRLWRAYSLH